MDIMRDQIRRDIDAVISIGRWQADGSKPETKPLIQWCAWKGWSDPVEVACTHHTAHGTTLCMLHTQIGYQYTVDRHAVLVQSRAVAMGVIAATKWSKEPHVAKLLARIALDSSGIARAVAELIQNTVATPELKT